MILRVNSTDHVSNFAGYNDTGGNNSATTGTHAGCWGRYNSSSLYGAQGFLLNSTELAAVNARIANGATIKSIKVGFTTISRSYASRSIRHLGWKTNSALSGSGATAIVSTLVDNIGNSNSAYHVESFNGFNSYIDIPISAGVPQYGIVFRPKQVSGDGYSDYKLDLNKGVALFYEFNEETVTLSYSANGKTASNMPSAKSQLISDPTAYTIDSKVPTAIGYTFAFWQTTTSYSSSGTKYNPGGSITLSTNTTLYAQWKKNFSITYNWSGIAKQTATASAPNITSYSFTLNSTATRDGYRLIGWNDGTKIYSPGATYVATGSHTLTPVWESVSRIDVAQGSTPVYRIAEICAAILNTSTNQLQWKTVVIKVAQGSTPVWRDVI